MAHLTPSTAALLTAIAEGTSPAGLIIGDSPAIMRTLPDNFVQTTITSPPYWALRDYNINGQIGLEATIDTYVAALVAVFDDVRRITKPDGTLWLNIGDSYTSGGRKTRATDKKNPARAMLTRPDTPTGLKKKDLIGVPWRIAFALQQSGWYLRSDIIWEKPNAMPESVQDRPTVSHEHVFLFSKNLRYKYNKTAVLGPNERNLRTVWPINTTPCADAHFATYPVGLVNPCVLLSTDINDLVFDPFTGAGTTGISALTQKRRFLGIELNPTYADIATKRIKEETTHSLLLAG